MLQCLGTFTVLSIRNHVRKCTEFALSGERVMMQFSRKVEGRIHQKASEQLKMAVFPVMKDDEIIRLIRFDWLLIVYGNRLCVKYTAHYQHDMIRSKLRSAGRILHEMKSICREVSDFASMYHPKYYDSLIDAIRIVGKFDSMENLYKSPSTAAAAVTQIREVGGILIGEFVRRDDSESQRITEFFFEIV